MKNEPDDTELDGAIRAILRRRCQELRDGHPARDPREQATILSMYWECASQARGFLLNCVKRRATAASFPGFHAAEDVVTEAILKGYKFLEAQYVSLDASFIFDPDSGRSIASWLTSVIGTGYGDKGGVLGDFLSRERRESLRYVGEQESQSSDDDRREPYSAAIGSDDVLAQSHAREALGLIDTILPTLQPDRRFAVHTLVLVRSGYASASNDDFWSFVEELVVQSFDGAQGAERLANLQRLRAKLTEAPTEGQIRELVANVVGRSSKQVGRWFDSFLDDVRAGRRRAA